MPVVLKNLQLREAPLVWPQMSQIWIIQKLMSLLPEHTILNVLVCLTRCPKSRMQELQTESESDAATSKLQGVIQNESQRSVTCYQLGWKSRFGKGKKKHLLFSDFYFSLNIFNIKLKLAYVVHWEIISLERHKIIHLWSESLIFNWNNDEKLFLKETVHLLKIVFILKSFCHF